MESKFWKSSIFTATVGIVHSSGPRTHGNKCHNNIWAVVPLLPARTGREIRQLMKKASSIHTHIQGPSFHFHGCSGVQMTNPCRKHSNGFVNVLVRLDFHEK